METTANMHEDKTKLSKRAALKKGSFVRELAVWTDGSSMKEQSSNLRLSALHCPDSRLHRSRLGTIQLKTLLGM